MIQSQTAATIAITTATKAVPATAAEITMTKIIYNRQIILSNKLRVFL